MREHFTCLQSLGLADEGFEYKDGNWSDLFESEDDVVDLRSSSGSRSADIRSSGGSTSSTSVSGSGEFGDVLLVRRRSDDKPYALKLFKTALSAADRERISYILYLHSVKKSEWPRSLVRYVRGYEFSDVGGGASQALLMERIDGVSFERMIAERRMAKEESQITCWLRDVLGALEFLHGNGVAHRDVHEGNIMVSRDGQRATLIDLDLACGAALPSERCTALCYDKASPKSTPPDLWCNEDVALRRIGAKQWLAGDMWGVASAFAALVMQQTAFVPIHLPYEPRGTKQCMRAFASPHTLVDALQKPLNTLKTQLFDKKALRRTLLQMLRIDWQQRPTARQTLQALPQCKSRSSFSMPLSDAEFFAAVERGEIELTGTYE